MTHADDVQAVIPQALAESEAGRSLWAAYWALAAESRELAREVERLTAAFDDANQKWSDTAQGLLRTIERLAAENRHLTDELASLLEAAQEVKQAFDHGKFDTSNIVVEVVLLRLFNAVADTPTDSVAAGEAE